MYIVVSEIISLLELEFKNKNHRLSRHSTYKYLIYIR